MFMLLFMSDEKCSIQLIMHLLPENHIYLLGLNGMSFLL